MIPSKELTREQVDQLVLLCEKIAGVYSGRIERLYSSRDYIVVDRDEKREVQVG